MRTTVHMYLYIHTYIQTIMPAFDKFYVAKKSKGKELEVNLKR